MNILYLLQQLMFVSLLLTAAWIVAKTIFGTSLGLTFREEATLLVPAGLGLFILLLFVLGIAHLLYLTLILFIFGGCSLAGLFLLHKRKQLPNIRQLAQGWTPAHLVLLLLGLMLLLPFLMAPLRPPIDSDEVRYHLPYALHFVEQHAITPQLYLRYPFHALNIDLLYAFGILAGDDVTTHFLHMSLGLLLAFSLFVLAARHSNMVIAWGAVFLFLSLASIQRLAASAYIDLGLACFGFSAMAGISYTDKLNLRPLMLCTGMLVGIAAGSKYLGLGFIPLFAVWAWYFNRNIRATAVFVLTALVVASPWYIYNFILSGNPISPFAGSLFGYWHWNETDAVGQISELVQHGTGHSLASLLAFPSSLINMPAAFQEFGGVPWLMVLLFPTLFYLPFWENSLKPFGVLFIVAFCIWFSGVQILRYFVTFTPLWCFFAVWGSVRALTYCIHSGIKILGRENAADKVGEPLASVMVVIFICTLHLPRPYEDFRVFPSEVNALVAGREAILTQTFPEYSAVQHINEVYADEIILQYEAWSSLAYVRNNLVVGDYFGLYRYSDIQNQFVISDEAGMQALRESGATLFLITKPLNLKLNTIFRSSMAVEYEDEMAIFFRVQDKLLGQPKL